MWHPNFKNSTAEIAFDLYLVRPEKVLPPWSLNYMIINSE
jgi:hypothetical protein